MSKAFTREDTEQDDDLELDDAPAVPQGTRNYMTPGGAKRLQDELRQLKHVERPEVTRVVSWAAGNGDRSENADYTYGKKRLREIDRRLRFLTKRLESAEVVDPTTVKADHVLFGATVVIRDEDDVEKRYSIVGVDEVDVSKGKISWLSPLANAIFKAKVGDWVTFRAPSGVKEIEVVSIEYKPID